MATGLGDLTNFPEATLAILYEEFTEAIERNKRLAEQVEAEFHRRLTERGATAILAGDYEARIERKTEWDRDALRPLLECEEIPEEALYKAYTPAHDELVRVEDKWDMTKVKPLAKYGKRVAQIIDQARRPGAGKLVIQRRQAAPTDAVPVGGAR